MLRSRRRPGTRPTGRPTFPAASSGSPSSMAAPPFGNAKARSGRLDLPGSGADSPRAAVYTLAARPGGQVSDLRGHASPIGCRRSTSPSRRTDFTGKDFPIILTSGRLVEYEGGGDESRSNAVAGRAAAGNVRRDQSGSMPTMLGSPKDGQDVWVEHAGKQRGSKVKAHVHPNALGAGVAFMPFHFGGHWMQGEDQIAPSTRRARIPMYSARRPTPRMTYGYDSVTQMQESKVQPSVASKSA